MPDPLTDDGRPNPDYGPGFMDPARAFALVSVFFYLRVVYYLYMKPVPRRAPAYAEPWPVRIVAGACALAMVALGVAPAWLLGASELAARTLVR